MKRSILLFVMAPASLVVGACGLNSVRVHSGGEVGAVATAVSEQAKIALAVAAGKRDEAWASLIASDTSCAPVDTLFLIVPDRPGLPRQKLCADGSASPVPPGFSLEEADGHPIPVEAIQPTLDLVGAVAVYGAAMSRIASEPKVDVSEDIAKAIGLAGKAEALATALGASKVPGIKDLGDDQKKSAIALINFFAELAHEKQQAKEIGILYDTNKDVIAAQLTTLEQQVTNWSEVIAKNSARVNLKNLERAYATEKDAMAFEKRLTMVTAILDARRSPERIDRAAAQFKGSVQQLRESQDALGNALHDPTPEQRRIAAAISRERAITALSLIADGISAWARI